ncbi:MULTISPECIES: response regulator transcription factor [Actinomadura]|uniref:Response regulator n=1 Tax=Actinomadura litoris TaxID=2678616 RepID=A0A7K1KXM3_9ACTN|nr:MULTISPECIES: response regulator transcription factor [Actinomadura]MBT2209246.1 response regulator transcription factor [Actinomadura sp. NEAU-AAG7]MUN36944.1 response regulator [Actinomadura litoris]
MSIRVLVVDDQAVVRVGFAAIVDGEPDMEVVGQAGDGAEALRLEPELLPDVVLMDIRMGGMGGLTATAELAARRSSARVLVLTTFHRDEYVYGALRAGASGFLLKDCDPQELVDAIRTVAGGEALLAPTVTRRLIDAFAAGEVIAPPAGDARLELLTRRERDVLLHVARGLSNTEVGAALDIGTATVKTHVNAILGKLDLRDRVQATIFAYDAGLVRPGDRPS